MPELPEVETVKEGLKKHLLGRKILDVKIYYKGIIAYPEVEEFIKNISNRRVQDIKRRGKFILFDLDNYYLISHLRMEGKYFIRDKLDVGKHDHIAFKLDNDKYLIYNDTRKFGKMYLIKMDDDVNSPLNKLGLEPWDSSLNIKYLKDKLNKNIPIKTLLLDQSIIVGIGNIYADEILFLSSINPHKKGKDLNDIELENIINNTKVVLEDAIKMGGTTIRSYSSVNGVHGLFQQELLVHNQNICKKCNAKIIKEKIGGRGTYYCPNCQK